MTRNTKSLEVGIRSPFLNFAIFSYRIGEKAKPGHTHFSLSIL